ncbi:cytochrome c [Roseovarius spongiae]|uniref:Cytochrome c n=1 Tax=Roseovarius spongiae TaxID=2320272 RepID=A0A3A8AX88_9RHOB|nr:cytochrome c [Roseovarius spongiae]RKF16346.1 cytochrome c [Roseovarius spongiae]
MRYLSVMAGLGAVAALAACVQSASMPEADEGRMLYAQNCAQCHGPQGRGDGPWARGMSPQPSDLTQLAEGGQFPRARVLSTIDGYHRAQLPGQKMPEFGALLNGPTVPVDVGDGAMTPTPRPLAALLAYLESIQGA